MLPIQRAGPGEDGRVLGLVAHARHRHRELTEIEEILHFRNAYFDRWSVETTIRQGKNRAGWGAAYEDGRVLKWRGIERMAFLVAAYQTLLGELSCLVATSPASVRPLLDRVWTSAADPADWRYRASLGLQRYLQDRLRQQRVRARRSDGDLPERAWLPLFGELAA